MKKHPRRRQVALTLLYAAVVFCIQIVSIALAGLVLYTLVRANVIVSVNDSSLDVYTVVIFLSTISLILGFILAFFTVKIPLNPMNKIIMQMNRLASGDFKARLAFGKFLSSFETFQQTTASFNKMAKELENTEMLRSDFINNLSHEFKTPIVSIAGFAKLLKKENLTDEQKAEYAAIIEEESLRLAHMAENVLRLTRIENQSILSSVSNYNLSEQLRGCVLLLENKWAQKKLSLDLQFEEHDIFANEELLKEVWINLLDNAIKFSKEGSEIIIELEESGGRYLISISNEGSEIPPEKQKKIFNKFYQGDESHASAGNGIGLAMVKKITELHRGFVKVNSASGFTTFTVSLPKRQY